MKELKVRLTFTEDLLGTASANPEIHEEFIASKAPKPETAAEEVAAIDVEAAIEKAMTVFPRMTDGTPFIYDYQIRGFFKEACGALKNVNGKLSSKIKAHKKKVDNHIFVEPRQIPLDMHGQKIDRCQRPLRAGTPQGERVTLANSEVAPEGTTIEFKVICLIDEDVEAVKEWLEYGALKGLGQWRNSGKGRMCWEELDDDGNVIGGNKKQ